MKKLLVIFIFFSLLVSVFAQISSFVDDQANVISVQDEVMIESALKNIYDSKQAEYAVITVQSLEGKDIESYALNLVQGKLGDSEKNNGLLLLIAVEDRKYRFEVGRGIEPILNDAKVGRIGRNFLVDNLKNGDYGKGILEATSAIANELNVKLNGNIPVVTQKKSLSFDTLRSLVLLIVFGFFLFGGINKKHRRRNRFFDAAIIASLMFGGGRGGHGGFGGMGGGLGGMGGFGGGGASGGF